MRQYAIAIVHARFAEVMWLARMTVAQEVTGSNLRCRQFRVFFPQESLRYAALGTAAYLLQCLGQLSLLPAVNNGEMSISLSA